MQIVRLVLAILVFVFPALSQEKPGQILLSGIPTNSSLPGGLWLVDKAKQTITPLQSVTGLLTKCYSITRDPLIPNRFIAGTFGRSSTGQPGPCDILEIFINSGKVTSWRKLSVQPLDEDYIKGVSLVGNEIFFVGAKTISRMPKGGGPAKVFFTYPNPYYGMGMVTDGRYVYAAVNTRNIIKIDIHDSTKLVLFFQASGGVLDLINGMSMDDQGNLLIVTACPWTGAALFQVDRQTGKCLRRISLLPMTGARAVAMDYLSGDIVISGGMNNAYSAVLVLKNWQVTQNPFGSLLNALPGLHLHRAKPLLRWGKTCPTNDQQELWINAIGLPRLGNLTYKLTLTTSLTGHRSAVLFLGRSGFHPVGFNFPLDLSGIGAPGCFLLAEPLLIMPCSFTAPQAAITLPIPAIPELSGLALDAQWLMADSLANGAGLVTSQRGTFVIE